MGMSTAEAPAKALARPWEAPWWRPDPSQRLIFFYLIGLGMVSGAQLNAALANAGKDGLKDVTNDKLKEPNRT